MEPQKNRNIKLYVILAVVVICIVAVIIFIINKPQNATPPESQGQPFPLIGGQ